MGLLHVISNRELSYCEIGNKCSRVFKASFECLLILWNTPPYDGMVDMVFWKISKEIQECTELYHTLFRQCLCVLSGLLPVEISSYVVYSD